MFQRWVHAHVRELLQIFPVVFLQGARQVGKTTFAQQMISEGVLHHYFTMDDPTVLASASQDPVGFVANLPVPTVVDEVQRVPQLLPVLKMRLDTQRQPGMFLLTGSANPFTLPKVSESLVGRMVVVTLYPLSQGEIVGHQEQWLRQLFAGQVDLVSDSEPDNILSSIVRGGFPTAVGLSDSSARSEWFQAYLTTLISRDLREVADIERVVELPRVLQLLASLSGRLLNVASLSRETGIPQTTLQRYLAYFQTLFLLMRVPAWYANLGKRLLKTPKLLLLDTGLTAFLLNADASRLANDPLLRGQLSETFVGLELLKQIHHTGQRVQLYHFRTDKGQEVDYVLEDAEGQLVAVEVKASYSVSRADFRGLEMFRDLVGSRLRAGIVLYYGSQTLPFGDRLWAQPLSALWKTVGE